MSSGKHLAVCALCFVLSMAHGCGGKSAAEADCDEAVDVAADWIQRCAPGTDRTTAERSAEAQITEGHGCPAITRVRDSRALHDACFPALEVHACDATSAPAACISQFHLE